LTQKSFAENMNLLLNTFLIRNCQHLGEGILTRN